MPLKTFPGKSRANDNAGPGKSRANDIAWRQYVKTKGSLRPCSRRKPPGMAEKAQGAASRRF